MQMLGTRSYQRQNKAGFSIVEALIAMTLGLIVLSAVIGILIKQLRTLEGSEIRENIVRNGRYIGAALRHDIQNAGIEIDATTSFGTLAVWTGSAGDTLMMLHVPYQPKMAPPRDIDPPSGTDNPLPPGGTCGSRCIDVTNPDGPPIELRMGDLARLQVGSARRLILISKVTESGEKVALEWTAADTLLRQPAGLGGGLLLDRYRTYVQKLTPVYYYLDDQQRLMRALSLNMDGSPDGRPLAYGVESFDVQVILEDGDVLEEADPYDADVTNDYDDIAAVRIRATLRAERVDPRVNNGQLLKHTYTWELSPRNLRYSRNR